MKSVWAFKLVIKLVNVNVRLSKLLFIALTLTFIQSLGLLSPILPNNDYFQTIYICYNASRFNYFH